MREKGKKVYSKTFTRNYSPTLGSKFWKNLFQLNMYSKEEALTEVEFYTAFCNKDSLKEFWNMSETYAARASRHFSLVSIALSKRVFLRTTTMDKHLISVKDYPFCH